MTPRFPTSPRFRRHQRSHFFRPLIVGLAVGGGLFLMFRSNTPEPVEMAAKPPQEQATPSEKTEQKLASGAAVQTEEKPKAGREVQQESKPNQKMVPIPLNTLAAKPEPKPEPKPESKPESKPEPKPESKPEPKLESKPVAEPNKLPSQANSSLSGQSGTTESKLAIKPAAKAPSKPESSSTTEKLPVAAQANAKTAAPSLPQAHPKQDEEEEGSMLSHPLPESLLPRPREQEMDLTFYKGLANKKVILPEEPTGKKVMPPFMVTAATKPAGTDKKHTPIVPEKAAQSKPLTERNKPMINTKKPADDLKKPADDLKKPADEKKRLPDLTDKSATNTSDKKNYQVQVALFSDITRATALADQLRSQGAANPRVSSIKYSSGRSLFRVRLGPFSSQQEAAKSAQRWQAAGQSAMVFSDE